MLHRARHAGLRVAIADVLPWNNGDSRAAADIDRLNELIRSIAEGQEVPLFGFSETLADPSRPTRMRETLTEDGDHPSVEGHRLLGERAFRPF
jgi:lysophospholipase L1-like esterase